VPGTRTVILSPHLDDAVLSCWHLLDGPADVRVLNVFAGTPAGPPGWWDRLTGATDAVVRMRERRDEDRAALATAGREAVSLDLLDAQYRCNGRDPLAVADVVAALRPHVDDRVVLYAPLGDCDHPDHRLARAAAIGLRDEVAELWLYVDVHSLPDDGGPPAGPPGLACEVNRLEPGMLERKLNAIDLYRTQAEMLRRLAPPEWLGEERVWRL
jgi:LmbE family N-acetylglucosaminyl deacetylase